MKTRIALLIVLLAVCAGGLLAALKARARSVRNHERAASARWYIQEQLTRPSNIGELTYRSNFVRTVYVPAIERASASLDKLERGDLELIPIAALVRKSEGDVLLWMKWFQRDESGTAVVLRDKNGVFASFSIVMPNGGLTSDPSTYLRTQVLRLSDTKATFFADSATPMVHVDRAPDLSSVHVSLSAEAKGAGGSDQMEAQLVPLGGDTTLPAGDATGG
jgi:hypothetical protein